MTTTTDDRITLPVLAAQLAPALGAGWTVRPRPDDDEGPWARHWGQLDGPEGAGLSLSLRDRRLHVSAEWPRGDGSEDYGPSRYTDEGRAARVRISLDPGRPVAALAREITRRVLTSYLAELPAAFARKAAELDRRAAQLTLAEQLAELVGEPLRERDREGLQRGGEVKLYTNVTHVREVAVHYGGAIGMHLSDLTLATAARVLEVVRAQTATELEADR